MIRDDIKFEVDQLRKDKVIYATEAVAVNAAAILGVFGSIFLISVSVMIGYVLVAVCILIGVGYTIFMGVGNFKRLQKIKELEKKLK